MPIILEQKENIIGKILFFVIANVISFSLSFTLWLYIYNGYWDFESTLFFLINYFLFFILSYIFKSIIDSFYIGSMEDSFLNFLRDLADAMESGLSFYNAFIFVSKNPYGRITKYLREVSKDILLGKPVKEAFDDLKRKVSESEYISKTLDIVLSVFYSGGNVVKVIRELYNSILEIKEVKKSKRNMLIQQIVILILIYAITLFIVMMIYTNLIPFIFTTDTASKILSEKGKIIGLDIIKPVFTFDFVKNLFIALVFLTGISIGSLVGMILTEKYSGSLKFSIIFLAISFLFYNLTLNIPVINVYLEKGAFFGNAQSTMHFVGILTVNSKPFINQTFILKFNKKIYKYKTDKYGMFEFNLKLPNKKGKYPIKFCIIYKYNKEYCYSREFIVK